jgi:PKD repeat protein
MKTIFTFIFSFVLAIPVMTAQSFYDDFESYNVNDYLGNSSSVWTTWSNAPGTSEDVQISNSSAASGQNSIYFESQWGGGPQDVVLPFGGLHTTGHFKFTSKWKVTGKTGAYFNLQGAASVGSTWALDVYMYDDGYIDFGGYIYTTYPQDQWFEIVIDIDLDQNVWEVFIDGVSQGSFTNWVSRVSHLDIYPLFSDTKFWVDDVSYCKDYACNPDISIDEILIDPSPLCSNHEADVTLKVTNNGPEAAKDFTFGLDLKGQPRINRRITMNGLGVGLDTTIIIPGMFKTNMNGTNLQIYGVNASRDRFEDNDTNMVTLDVLPSPSGFEFVKGSTFQGRFDVGVAPDLIEAGKTNSYELVPSTGFTNANYSSAWSIPSVIAVTESGMVVPSSDYTVTYPSGSTNGKLIFTGSDTYMDSIITFMMTVKNLPNGCDSVVKRKIRIVPTPKVNFKLPPSICLGDDIPFENLSSVHSGTNLYKWFFDDGDSSDADNPFHEFTTAGFYDIKLIATSQPWGIVRDTTITIKVSEIPDVKFRANNKCQGIAVEFQNQSSVSSGTMTYDWDFGDGSSHSLAKDPSHLYASPGGYKVTLKVDANGCQALLVKNAYMFARPVADFVAPATPVCSKTQVELENTSTLASGRMGALWTFGDGGLSTMAKGLHTYQASGTYMVKLLSISEFECKDSVTKQVVIKPSPEPNFVGNQFCGKIPTVFTNTTSEALPNPVYNWTFSDNYTSNLKHVTRSWPYEGPFSATLKADYSNGCSGTTTKDFTVYIQPKADFNVDDICSGETARFVNKSQGDRAGMVFDWDFGDSDSSSDMAPSNMYNPPVTTTYTVTLVVSYPQACSDTVRKSITVSESPVCDFTYKTLGFLNTEFTPSIGTYAKYEWFFGEGGTDIISHPKYQYTYAGNFNVTMRATNAAGCTCEVTKKVAATTSVKSLNTANGISIYPNPNNGTFTVKNVNNESMNVEVFTILGSKIFSRATDGGEMKVSLDDHAKGIYLVKVTMNGITSTSKVTVN